MTVYWGHHHFYLVCRNLAMNVKGENYVPDFGSLIIYSKYKMRFFLKKFYVVINLPYGFIFEFLKFWFPFFNFLKLIYVTQKYRLKTNYGRNEIDCIINNEYALWQGLAFKSIRDVTRVEFVKPNLMREQFYQGSTALNSLQFTWIDNQSKL